MKEKKIIVFILCIVVALSGFAPYAFADWYDDVKSGCTWVEIKGDNFVADTFCSVEARYNENDYYYQCNELIMRFYREAYGLDVMAYSNTGLIMLTEGYEFVETQTPKKGDIIYVSAQMRNSSSDHWAIVKDYGNGYITMFEQNVIWEGKAAVNRQIKFPSDSYYLLTPVSLGSMPEPKLKGTESEEVKSTTVKATAVTTTEATTTRTTEKPTVITTTKATTTRTTEKPTVITTTKATSTRTAEKPTVITTAKPTTTRTAEKTTVITTVEAATTTVYIPAYNTSITTQAFDMPTLLESSANSMQSEKDDSGTLPKIILCCLCAALAILIAFAVVIIIKKK